MFYIFFIICFICHIIRISIDLHNYKRKKTHFNRIIKIVLSGILMITLWSSWFQLSHFDPVKIFLPVWIEYSGMIVFFVGLFLFLGGFLQLFINYLINTSRSKLIINGIFSIIKHPVYYGCILWTISYPVFNKSLLTLISSPIWISFIIFWIILEERELDKKFDNYKEYKQKTWI